MNDVEAKVIAARQLRKRGFTGFIASHTLYPDEALAINAAGTDETYLTMSEAGIGLAHSKAVGKAGYNKGSAGLA